MSQTESLPRIDHEIEAIRQRCDLLLSTCKSYVSEGPRLHSGVDDSRFVWYQTRYIIDRGEGLRQVGVALNGGQSPFEAEQGYIYEFGSEEYLELDSDNSSFGKLKSSQDPSDPGRDIGQNELCHFESVMERYNIAPISNEVQVLKLPTT